MRDGDELAHLLPAHRPYALLAAAERIHWLRQERWIQYTRAEEVLVRLGELLAYPPHDRMPALLLFGVPGMGKTRIVHRFLREHGSRFDPQRGTTHLPAVALQMPPTPHERDFYEELLVAMEAVLPVKLSLSNLRQRVRVLARQLGVRMLIIDEIHSMLSGTFREQRIFLNALRFLANDLRLPLVCVGIPEAKQALMTDQQLADRFEARELPTWRDDTTFHQFLASFGASLPLRQASELRESALRKRILSLSEGITVRICRLLEEAAVQAILSGRERIELETLSEALLASSLVSISERRQRRAAVPVSV
jgi:DNA polymerase III delta prime subunit